MDLERKVSNLENDMQLVRGGSIVGRVDNNIQKIVAPSKAGYYPTITAAYNALPSTGGKIWVLESTVEPVGVLTIIKPIILEGMSPGTSERDTDNPVKINFPQATTIGIHIRDTVCFRNICLIGPGKTGNSVTGLRIGSTGTSSGDKSVFENVVIKNFGGYGVQCQGQLAYVNFYNLVMDSIGVGGIYYYADGSDYVNSCNIFGGKITNTINAFKTDGTGEKHSSYINIVNGDNNSRGLYLAGNFRNNYIIMGSWSPSVEDYYIDSNSVKDNYINILASTISGTDGSNGLNSISRAGAFLGLGQTAPSPVIEGAIYWDTVANRIKVYDGTTWRNLAVEA